jgi:regulator of protease activity HflC (stomatin/prohibitin superfamily)
MLYIVGSGLLFLYFIRNRPQFEGKFVELPVRPLFAIFWIWGALMWPFSGLLWLGVLPIPAFPVLMFTIFIPLTLFTAFFIWVGVFPLAVTLPLFVISLFGAALGLPFLFMYAYPPLQMLLFFVFVTLPPLLSILLFARWGGRVIPLGDEQTDGLRSVLGMLIGFFTRFPKSTWMVVNGKVESRVEGNPFLGTGPGWVMTEPDNAVVIKQGSNIKSVAGPGVVFTEAAETVHSVVDLRQQIRVTRVEAITRDGIKVSVPIASIFRINPEGNYRAIFTAAEVDPEGKTPLEAHVARPWEDLPLDIATHQLKQVIAQYTLDELYNAGGAAAVIPRATIGQQVREVVTSALRSKGIQVDGGGVGNKIIPMDEEVTEQRIEHWKARWISQRLEERGRVHSERLEKLAKIRGEAQSEIMLDILVYISETAMLEPHNPAFVSQFARRLLDNLRQIASAPEVRSLIPDSAALTLEDLQSLGREGAR